MSANSCQQRGGEGPALPPVIRPGTRREAGSAGALPIGDVPRFPVAGWYPPETAQVHSLRTGLEVDILGENNPSQMDIAERTHVRLRSFQRILAETSPTRQDLPTAAARRLHRSAALPRLARLRTRSF